jgi:uncharacterized membrane protein
VAAWLLGGGLSWLMGAALIFAVVPFTLIVIMPINHQLMDPSLDRRSDATHALLHAWGRLRGVRTVLSIIASLVFLAVGLRF